MVKKLFFREKEDTLFPMPILIVLFLLLFILVLIMLPSSSRIKKVTENVPSYFSLESFQFDPETFFVDRGLAEDVEAKKAEVLRRYVSRTDTDTWAVYQVSGLYSIEYYTSHDVFGVTITSEPYDLYKNQVEDWFLNQGFRQEDLCNLPVRFVAPYLSVGDLKDVSLLFPTGCPIS